MRDSLGAFRAALCVMMGRTIFHRLADGVELANVRDATPLEVKQLQVMQAEQAEHDAARRHAMVGGAASSSQQAWSKDRPPANGQRACERRLRHARRQAVKAALSAG